MCCRAEKNYAVSSGKWYFEFEILTAGPMRVGWAHADCAPGQMLGCDENSWAFDGYNVSISSITHMCAHIIRDVKIFNGLVSLL